MGQKILDANAPEYIIPHTASNVCFQHVVLDAEYNTEGASTADINKDGLLDIVTGYYWYEAPNWQRHIIRAPAYRATTIANLSDYVQSFYEGKGVRGVWETSYPLAFFTFHQDINNDGWVDVIALDLTGQGGSWFENPKGGHGEWVEQPYLHSSRNESPLYADLLQSGTPQVITGHAGPHAETGQIEAITFTVDKGPILHPIRKENDTGNNGATKFSHGLGVGDLNLDGIPDVIFGSGLGTSTGGWYEQQHTAAKSVTWKKHIISPMIDASQIHVQDIGGDEKPDLIAGASHHRGLFWFEQKAKNVWKAHVIDDSYTQLHASAIGDIDGDGQADIIAGKTPLAHFGLLDEDEFGTPVLYWYRPIKNEDGQTRFERHLVSDKVGVGRQIAVVDMNNDNLTDIVVGNRNGLHLFLQSRININDQCS